jgi:ABC-type nickel/cobalt efflux system permease component RcnA
VITFLSIVLLGFFLGMRHATDSDHVVAVTTIVSKQRSIGSAALTGIFWGIGHSLTLLFVGGAIIFFGVVVPKRLGLSLEFCVALMLILLGALNLRGALRALRMTRSVARSGHSHEHTHHDGEWVHTHPHGHGPEKHGHREDSVPPARLDRIFGRAKWYRALRPLAIGLVHGLAGSAALALLVLPIIGHPLWALAYLCVFGLGTIVGMMLITMTIAVPITYAARFGLFHRHFGAVAGVFSVAFGLFLAYQIGFVNGLLRH